MSACVTISESNLSKAISIAEKYEIAEVRLDLCGFNWEQIKKLFSSHKNLIATFRLTNNFHESKMVSLTTAIEFGAAYVDVEHDMNPSDMDKIIQHAKSNNTRIIYSYHNFTGTDSDLVLKDVIRTGNNLEAAYIKIAAKASNKHDVLRLLNLYTEHSNLIAFSLGEEYKYTRICSFFLGAPFLYVYHGYRKNQLAEGQLSSREYEHIMKNLSTQGRI